MFVFKTNNHITMKKKIKNFKDVDLIVDIIEYAFIEWLVRQGIFSAFKTNYEAEVSPRGSFRDALRGHIRHCLRSSNFGPIRLISTAFLFVSTPEGPDFWRKHSVAWERFYLKL